VKALVLAAGRGERLRPLTDSTPKPLLELGGRPLIHYPIAMLRRAGVTDVAINVHHLGGRIQSALGRGAREGVNIIWSPEPKLLGTGGALNVLRSFLGDDTFIIVNSDTILDLDLAAMIAAHRDRAALATIALYRAPNADYYSEVQIDSQSRIRRIRLLKRREPREFDDFPRDLEPGIAESLESFMYCGVIVAEPAVLDLIPPNPPWSLMHGLFAPMVANALPVFGFVHRGLFRTVDDLKSYEALRQEFESGKIKLLLD
jgi:NDP-sugar pyrophosphorylase family protein